MIKLNEIRRIQKSGIYGIRNDQEKKVQIFGSLSMLKHLNYILENGQFELDDNVVFEVLEDNLSELEIKVLMLKWVDFYKQQNYSLFYDRKRYYPKYIVREGLQVLNGKYYSCVYLENIRRDKIIVGVFTNVKESKQFLLVNYPTSIITH